MNEIPNWQTVHEAEQEAMDNPPAGPLQGTYQPNDEWLIEAEQF